MTMPFYVLRAGDEGPGEHARKGIARVGASWRSSASRRRDRRRQRQRSSSKISEIYDRIVYLF